MATTYTLAADSREVTGKKVSQLRVKGLIPAVIYGSGTEPVHIQVPERDLYYLLLKAGGTNVIEIQVGSNKYNVLTRDVQRDVIKGNILHADFLAIDLRRRIQAEVPVTLVGESAAEKSRIGTILHALNSVQIEALPANIPERIEVDITNLAEVGDSITIGDLNLEGKFDILAEPDALIARVNPVVQAAETTEEEAPSASEPEVISKGKADEEEE